MAGRDHLRSTVGQRRRYHTERPDNIKIWRSCEGVTYFKYVFPDGKTKGLGSDQAQAFAVADALNAHFKADAVAKALKPRRSARNPLIADAISAFQSSWVKKKTYSDRSRSEIRIRLEGYKKSWDGLTVQEVELGDLADLLNECTPNTYPKHRTQLTQLWQYFASQGWAPTNIAMQTMPPAETPTKVRRRHDAEQFWQIHNAETTPTWLKQAMRLGLYTLQRESDLVGMQRAHVKDNCAIRVAQAKTLNYKEPVVLNIVLEGEALETLRECLASDIPCPNLIHRRPQRMTARKKQSKTHPFAVTAKYLSKAFTKARDACGAYADLAPEERPTFHEIRSLGEWLYLEQGFSKEYVMALGGWADERMLTHYSIGHGDAAKTVRAGLRAKPTGLKAVESGANGGADTAK